MDETHAAGANMFHFRLGPWAGDAEHESEWVDIGGAYKPGGLEWNTAYWEKVRALTWHAFQMGAWVEVVPIDSWYIKVCRQDQSQCPWPQAEVQAAGRAPAPEAERLLRKSVEELGCFGNVIWATGNEEDLVPGMSVSWLNWEIEVLRDAEDKTGCNFVHMIGTGSFQSGINADYSITHERAAVTGSCRGRWCLNNEHNPAFSPDQEASNFATARGAGQAWAAWRADASDADWEKRLELFREIAGGSAPAVGCYAPDAEDPSWGATLTPAQRPAQMMAALNAAKAVVGNRCGATAPCDHEPTAEHPCAPPVHLGCLETNGLVAAELRKQGYCATGPWTDATAILAPDGWYEEMHVCSTGDGCYTGNPYKLAWRYNGAGPTPLPTPPPDGCTGSVCAVSEVLCKLHQPGQGLWDCTPKCPGGQPVRPEGDPDRFACEIKACGGGPPNFFLTGAGIELVKVENPFQFRIVGSGTGTVTCDVPANIGTNVCKAGDTTVQQGIPVSR